MIENAPLKRGEYDLVNISIIGFDPITGRSSEECILEHEEACARVEAECKSLRWWQVRKRFAIARKAAILSQRQGLGGYSL